MWRITKVDTIFHYPKGLHPVRSKEHAITLLPREGPINVPPYRYPYHKKKNEIESSSIVGHGHVRPNQSDYSSPVLFVKKKMLLGVCVDFKALNKGTIPDKFPISVIEELLDKLHRSRFFSKLDLKFGYHQVMMKKEDIHKIDFRLMNAFQVGNAFSTFQAHMNIVSR